MSRDSLNNAIEVAISCVDGMYISCQNARSIIAKSEEKSEKKNPSWKFWKSQESMEKRSRIRKLSTELLDTISQFKNAAEAYKDLICLLPTDKERNLDYRTSLHNFLKDAFYFRALMHSVVEFQRHDYPEVGDDKLAWANSAEGEENTVKMCKSIEDSQVYDKDEQAYLEKAIKFESLSTTYQNGRHDDIWLREIRRCREKFSEHCSYFKSEKITETQLKQAHHDDLD